MELFSFYIYFTYNPATPSWVSFHLYVSPSRLLFLGDKSRSYSFLCLYTQHNIWKNKRYYRKPTGTRLIILNVHQSPSFPGLPKFESPTVPRQSHVHSLRDGPTLLCHYARVRSRREVRKPGKEGLLPLNNSLQWIEKSSNLHRIQWWAKARKGILYNKHSENHWPKPWSISKQKQNLQALPVVSQQKQGESKKFVQAHLKS